jgi:hypothetical protein
LLGINESKLEQQHSLAPREKPHGLIVTVAGWMKLGGEVHKQHRRSAFVVAFDWPPLDLLPSVLTVQSARAQIPD